MRKHAFVALIMLMMSILAGCGGGGASSTLVASTDETFVSLDVSSRTVYILPAYTSLSNGYKAYRFSSNSNAVTYDSDLNKDVIPVLAVNGTWDTTNGILTLKDLSGNTLHAFKRIQTETAYWLVYDTNNSNKISRIYFDNTETAQASAANYLNSIFKTASTYLLAGTMQWLTASNPNTDYSTKAVSTLAGSSVDAAADYKPGLREIARFNHPTGITTDGTDLYVTDSGNHAIRKITLAGDVTNFAGTGAVGSADGTGTAASFSSPQGITSDGTNLYVADTGNGLIRKIKISTKEVTTLAGTAGSLGAIDNNTSGVNAKFYQPFGITTDGTNLYVTDVSYHTVRKVKIATVSGTSYSQSVTTLAGYPNSAGSADGTSTSARFNGPARVTTDGTNLYVTDNRNHTIRKIVIATGETSTMAGDAGSAGSSNDGTGQDEVNKVPGTARFYYPSGITTDGINLYVTEFNESAPFINVVRKIVIASKLVTTIAGGSSTTLLSEDTNNALTARFSGPLDIISDGIRLFITNYINSNVYAPTNNTYPSFNNIRQIGQ
jgi:hypothetical protein